MDLPVSMGVAASRAPVDFTGEFDPLTENILTSPFLSRFRDALPIEALAARANSSLFLGSPAARRALCKRYVSEEAEIDANVMRCKPDPNSMFLEQSNVVALRHCVGGLATIPPPLAVNNARVAVLGSLIRRIVRVYLLFRVTCPLLVLRSLVIPQDVESTSVGTQASSFLAALGTAGGSLDEGNFERLLTSSDSAAKTQTRRLFGSLVARVRAEHKAALNAASIRTSPVPPSTLNARRLVSFTKIVLEKAKAAGAGVNEVQNAALLCLLLQHVFDVAIAEALLPVAVEFLRAVHGKTLSADVAARAADLASQETSLIGLAVCVCLRTVRVSVCE